jgi:hypothetical protein
MTQRGWLGPAITVRAWAGLALAGLVMLSTANAARAEVDAGPWPVTCGTFDDTPSYFRATPDGPPRLELAVYMRTMTFRKQPGPQSVGMSKAVCEQTAAWINDRCRNNMDARAEQSADGEVMLSHSLAAWVALHWNECAAINTPPREHYPTGGQCKCIALSRSVSLPHRIR